MNFTLKICHVLWCDDEFHMACEIIPIELGIVCHLLKNKQPVWTDHFSLGLEVDTVGKKCSKHQTPKNNHCWSVFWSSPVTSHKLIDLKICREDFQFWSPKASSGSFTKPLVTKASINKVRLKAWRQWSFWTNIQQDVWLDDMNLVFLPRQKEECWS